VPQRRRDVDHNPTRNGGILPGYCPSLTLRVGILAVLPSTLSSSCDTSQIESLSQAASSYSSQRKMLEDVVL
jgi:hypothetical protein